MTLDAPRLASLISPLRRSLLAATREREHLPHISDAQVEIVRALPRGTVLAPGELAQRLGLERSTVSNQLKSMERDGLIIRRPRADDRRGVEVEASDTALGYFDRFDAVSAEIIRSAASSLSEPDLAALERALPALEHLTAVLVKRRREKGTP